VFYHDPVVADKGHHITYGPDGDDIEFFLQVYYCPGKKTIPVHDPSERLKKEEDNPACREIPRRESGVFPFRIDKGICPGCDLPHFMVVYDDRIDTAIGGVVNLFDIR
jgi:hypothetical protein